MPTIIGLAPDTTPPTRIFSSTPIAPAQSVVYSVPLLDVSVHRLRPAAPRRDPRPVTLRLDAEDVNEETWRQIKLIVWKPDESICEASLLRPLWWIAETGAKVGGMIHLAMTDMGVVGPAKVLAINPCPKIAPDVPGKRSQVVIGKFKHTARFLLRVHFEGLDTPLEVTPNHPVFSLDRGTFVAAGSLRIGERCKSRQAALVAKIEVKYGSVPVYNLEVHRDHTFLVTKLGILVHNSYEVTAKQESDIDQYLQKKGMTTVKNPNEAQGSGDRVIDGLPTEYKTLTDVQNPTETKLSSVISSRAMDARSQAPNVVIDARSQPDMTLEAAVRGAMRAFGADRTTARTDGTAPKLVSIRIILKDVNGFDTDCILYQQK